MTTTTDEITKHDKDKNGRSNDRPTTDDRSNRIDRNSKKSIILLENRNIFRYNNFYPTQTSRSQTDRMFSKSVSAILFAVFAMASTASASVFLGGVSDVKASPFAAGRSSCQVTDLYRKKSFEAENKRQQMARMVRRNINPTTKGAAMAIPGYGVAEQVFVGGFANFLSIYNLVITARVLLSWFPQAQGVAVLQPVYQITDPYLNLFRGLIPPVFGLDLSPILAFVLLNVLTQATAAVGAEISPNDRKKLQAASPFGVKPYKK